MFRVIARNWPYFDRYGFYSLFPLFFAAGFGLELFMIKFEFSGHSFYDTFNRRQLENLREEIEEQEAKIKTLLGELSKEDK